MATLGDVLKAARLARQQESALTNSWSNSNQSKQLIIDVKSFEIKQHDAITVETATALPVTSASTRKSFSYDVKVSPQIHKYGAPSDTVAVTNKTPSESITPEKQLKTFGTLSEISSRPKKKTSLLARIFPSVSESPDSSHRPSSCNNKTKSNDPTSCTVNTTSVGIITTQSSISKQHVKFASVRVSQKMPTSNYSDNNSTIDPSDPQTNVEEYMKRKNMILNFFESHTTFKNVKSLSIKESPKGKRMSINYVVLDDNDFAQRKKAIASFFQNPSIGVQKKNRKSINYVVLNESANDFTENKQAIANLISQSRKSSIREAATSTNDSSSEFQKKIEHLANLFKANQEKQSNDDSYNSESINLPIIDKYDKFRKMLKLNLPKLYIKQQMAALEYSMEDINTFFEDQEPPQTPMSENKLSLVNPMDKYDKMKKLGVPDGSIRQKMTSEGVATTDIDSFFNHPTSSKTSAAVFTSTSSPRSIVEIQSTKTSEIIDETGLFEKYIKMKKMSVPEGGIRQKMISDQLKEDDIKLFFECLAIGNIIKRPEKSFEEIEKESRMAVFKAKTFEIKSPEKVSVGGPVPTQISPHHLTLVEELRQRKMEANRISIEKQEQLKQQNESKVTMIDIWNQESNIKQIKDMIENHKFTESFFPFHLRERVTKKYTISPSKSTYLSNLLNQEAQKFELDLQLRRNRFLNVITQCLNIAYAAGATLPFIELIPINNLPNIKKSEYVTNNDVTKLKNLLKEWNQLVQAEEDCQEVKDSALHNWDSGFHLRSRNKTSDHDTSLFGTYRKMRRMCMPELMIRQKMTLDGFSNDEIESFLQEQLVNPILEICDDDVSIDDEYGSNGTPRDAMLVPSVFHYFENPLSPRNRYNNSNNNVSLCLVSCLRHTQCPLRWHFYHIVHTRIILLVCLITVYNYTKFS